MDERVLAVWLPRLNSPLTLLLCETPYGPTEFCTAHVGVASKSVLPVDEP